MPAEPTEDPSRAQYERAQSERSLGSFDGVKFLTVAEVATLMRVSKMSVYRMIHGGELDAVRFGRNFRVPESAVHDYLRSSFYDVG
ncbi:MAG TPA: helix-turn-helix domain-containing protein [Candidatus Avipropionibacterium avicola]|uniref:Helix-turn-helix domain-containing protein n=1 Tax=Candidatus Avipropionibacterium avicola TaxID=2840701 RepID=A0A9D1GYM1_9ACTN|nr:helix-turn-helix domain-containing protein [Candidatus Avipropionibacterium avicola]